MGFLDKIKNALGIGGVKVKLQIPTEVTKESGIINGKITFTSKSDKKVKDYLIELKEAYKTGRGDDQTTKVYELGKIEIKQGFEIKAGETKEIDFSLPFHILQSKNDQMKEQGGVMGALGKAGSFLDAEKSTYTVETSVSVEGTFLGPTDVKNIKLTGN
jgi:hypothetical protein